MVSRARPALRWYEVAPEALLAAGLGFFLIDQTDAATSALTSTKALALMAGVGAAWVAGRLLAWRWVRPAAIRLGGFGLAAAAILAVVVLPAYDDETVVEAFPPPASATTTVPAGDATAPPSTSATTATTATTAAPQPERIRTGSFRGIDHRAEGTVSVYRRPAGGFVVGLEEFDIQPGPDYDLYVVPGADRDDLDGAVRLDDLRGNRGTQFYDVPAGVDLNAGDWTVLVWCETFAVPIANATPV